MQIDLSTIIIKVWHCKTNMMTWVVFSTTELVCPEGWVKHQSHDCLKVFTDTPCNYAAAITACEDNSATLASVHSVFVADVIGSMV